MLCSPWSTSNASMRMRLRRCCAARESSGPWTCLLTQSSLTMGEISTAPHSHAWTMLSAVNILSLFKLIYLSQIYLLSPSFSLFNLIRLSQIQTPQLCKSICLFRATTHFCSSVVSGMPGMIMSL